MGENPSQIIWKILENLMIVEFDVAYIVFKNSIKLHYMPNESSVLLFV